MNDRTPRENHGRLSQTTSKVYRLHAPIPHLSSHQQHKARCLRYFGTTLWAPAKEGGSRDQRWDMRSKFLSIALAAYTCSESDKIYRMQHFWYNVVMPCFASFSRFRFLLLFCNRTKICQKNRNLEKLAKHGITTLYHECCSP